MRNAGTTSKKKIGSAADEDDDDDDSSSDSDDEEGSPRALNYRTPLLTQVSFHYMKYENDSFIQLEVPERQMIISGERA